MQNKRKLRESVIHGCSLPAGWYVFIYPDGSRSHELTGINYPTSEIITSVHGGDNMEQTYQEIVKCLY